MQARIYFLDNLRTFMIFLVILLHAGISYVSGMDSFWIVSDPEKCESLSMVNMYLDLFIMFVIFFISGYFIPFSVAKSSTQDFLISKFKRILLPWIVAVFTLIPAFKTIFIASRGLPQEEWHSYFLFFQRNGSNLSFFANNPTQSWLWFLPVLFIFQVLYFTLNRTKLLRINISLRTGVVLTFITGLVYSILISAAGLKGWFHSILLDFQRERILIYFMVFLLGSLCYKLRIFDSLEKNRRYFILSQFLLTISLGMFTVVALNFFFNIINPGRDFYLVSDFFDRIIYYMTLLMSMLGFLYILIYVFRFSFNKTNWLMSMLNEYSYSVYIIHVVVLGVLALALINIPIHAFLKYLILAIMTFVVSNLLVYAYKRVFKNWLPFIAATLAVLVVVFIIFSGLGSNTYSGMANEKSEVSRSDLTLLETGLHEAVVLDRIEIIEAHIKSGSDLNEREKSGGSSPLITAATLGNTEAALALIDGGADINFRNNVGSTPLHAAAFFCHKEIVEALLANRADTSIRNDFGSTALESVIVPFEEVRGYYDHFGRILGPLGLDLDYEQIKKTRPVIATMLK